ncbi:MAG: hypothetical protein KIT84_28805 [Labilithrix sp.]|nr:hypothetical protein [Labilithrix sp.]MCW5815061.1 hypothetical protein [Labilithrix sp.]
MASPKYPLKPLLEHRERAARDRTAELGGAVRARETAELAKERAEATKREAESADAAVRAEEADLLDQGELRAVDLARGQAWEIGAQARLADLTRTVDVAGRRAVEARTAEDGARTELAGALADRDVVAKDEARFRARHEKKVLAAEEEQAEEAFRPTRGVRG